MNIVIVGGGASGLLSALAIKKYHPTYNVLVIDKNNKLGKKLRATGNGKCNMCNIGDIKNKYSNEIEANKLFNKVNVKELIKFFNDNGIATRNYGDYVYPYSESANMLTDTLINNASKLGVKFVKETKALDYKNNVLITDKGKYNFDKLIIATGLGSSPKLGADSSFISNLSKHGYKINKITPILLPIKTIESTKEVNGIRAKVNLKVISNNKTYMNEDGELIFKKDGISGIVTYHASSFIIRNNLKNPDIVIDFLPGINNVKNLSNYFVPELVNYLKNHNQKKVVFHVKGYYSSEDSVASFGGVDFKNIKDNYESKLEKGIYIIGEALDQVGLCGGYNLMWAFTTALKVSKDI